MTYLFTCKACGETTAVNCPAADRPAWQKCPACGDRANRDFQAEHGPGRNATTGEWVSVNAGVAPKQVARGNRDLANAGIDARYRKHDGTLVCKDRREFLKVLKVRGMHSNTDGGFPLKVRPLKDKKLRTA